MLMELGQSSITDSTISMEAMRTLYRNASTTPAWGLPRPRVSVVDASRQARRFPGGGSGSSELEVMQPATDAASDVVGWFVA
jgi:hypothetical protein